MKHRITWEEYRQEFSQRPLEGDQRYRVFWRLYGLAQRNLWPFPEGGLLGDYRRPDYVLPEDEDGSYRWGRHTWAKDNATEDRRVALEVMASFRSTGCARCGENDDACLEAHHRERETKQAHVAALYGRGQGKRLARELALCVCLCSNCHRKYHAGRFTLDTLLKE